MRNTSSWVRTCGEMLTIWSRRTSMMGRKRKFFRCFSWLVRSLWCLLPANGEHTGLWLKGQLRIYLWVEIWGEMLCRVHAQHPAQRPDVVLDGGRRGEHDSAARHVTSTTLYSSFAATTTGADHIDLHF
jgi:hypothetical protein